MHIVNNMHACIPCCTQPTVSASAASAASAARQCNHRSRPRGVRASLRRLAASAIMCVLLLAAPHTDGATNSATSALGITLTESTERRCQPTKRADPCLARCRPPIEDFDNFDNCNAPGRLKQCDTVCENPPCSCGCDATCLEVQHE